MGHQVLPQVLAIEAATIRYYVVVVKVTPDSSGDTSPRSHGQT
jgi:hypothetical protein